MKNKKISKLYIIPLVLIIIGVYLVVDYNTKIRSGSIIGDEEKTITVVVTDKARVSWIDGSTNYLIYSRDSDGNPRVFLNMDYGDKWNCSDFQEQIDVGSIYTFTTIGERIPEKSSYPNIMEYELVFEGPITKQIENTWIEYGN